MRGSSSLARAEAGRRRGTRGLGAVAGLVAGAWRPDAGLLVAGEVGGWSPARVEAGGGCVREATGSWEGSALGSRSKGMGWWLVGLGRIQ